MRLLRPLFITRTTQEKMEAFPYFFYAFFAWLYLRIHWGESFAMQEADPDIRSTERQQVNLASIEVHFFWILIVFLCPVLLATMAYSVFSDDCGFLSLFRSGKLPGSPQSGATALIFLLGGVCLYVGALRYDIAFWKIKRQSIVISELLKTKGNIFGQIFGDFRAHLRVFVIYPSTSFFCTYVLLLILNC